MRHPIAGAACRLAVLVIVLVTGTAVFIGMVGVTASIAGALPDQLRLQDFLVDWAQVLIVCGFALALGTYLQRRLEE